MANVTITTTIDVENHALAQREGWGWSELIRAGIAHKKNPKMLQEEVEFLRKYVEAQSKKIKIQQKSLPSWSLK